MPRYELVGNEIELYFEGIPSDNIRTEMKDLKIWWNPKKKCWHGEFSEERLALAERLCNNEASTGSVTVEQDSTDASDMAKRCCYCNSVKDFLYEEEDAWADSMEESFRALFSMPLEYAQKKAWRDCFRTLQQELGEVEARYPGLQIIFEYVLPYESGRRPDVILLCREHVIVLEFKQRGDVQRADIDQVKAYARDLSGYHHESKDKVVTPVLLLTGTSDQEPQRDPDTDVILCSKGHIVELVSEIITGEITPCQARSWMESEYVPLPTIVETVRSVFRKKELPSIRRVNSTAIPQAKQCLADIARDAEANSKHVLALVTGVPGAGKTYLGLEFVYDIRKPENTVDSVYLTGNGPLVEVLQDALGPEYDPNDSKCFVKHVNNVLDEFLSGRMTSFESNIIVFDEAQRAWDLDHMRKRKSVEESEPDVLVRLCDEKMSWCVLLVLVGEGQHIHYGEGSGVSLWNESLRRSTNPWSVVCPEKLRPIFEDEDASDDKSSLSISIEPALNLNQSLRTHAAGEVSNFVNAFLKGELSEAAAMARGIKNDGFDMYYTRDLEAAKQYCRDRYSDSVEKRFGYIASSKSSNTKRYKMKPAYQPDVAKWFNGEPSDPLSSCSLKVIVSEFDCQGLEIDMPIVGWSDDIWWKGTNWGALGITKEEREFRINSYRVLLTRGRDGFIVFIPPEQKMDVVEDVFKKAGVREL